MSTIILLIIILWGFYSALGFYRAYSLYMVFTFGGFLMRGSNSVNSIRFLITEYFTRLLGF